MLDPEQIHLCGWCIEPILRGDFFKKVPCLGDDGVTQIHYHHDCMLRIVAGSVAHQQRRCSCFVKGSTEEDPPGMTKREAARAAAALWQQQHG